jgi:hypothetical protein
MSRLATLKDTIQYRIKKSKEIVFFASDFEDLSGRNQILRALKNLVNEHLIIKVGQGVYTKAIKSPFSDKYIPADNLRNIAISFLKKVGVEVIPTRAELDYNNKQTTQVPDGFIIGVSRKVSRSISFGDAVIRFEKVEN